MSQETMAKHKDVSAVHTEANAPHPRCNGQCDGCPNAVASEVKGVAEGDETACKFGWKYLWTDLVPLNLFGVSESDALGHAAKFAQGGKV